MKIKNLSLIFLFCGMQSLAFAQSSPIYVNGSNVGIGTAAPSTSLHVVSSGTTISSFESTSAANLAYIGLKNAAGQNAFIGNDSSGTLHFQTPGGDFSSKLVIDSSGKVGIATKTPTQKLQVKGQILVNQNEGSASGLYLRSDAAPAHYNWKISTQEVVDGGFEIASSTVPGGTTFRKPIFVINQNGKVGIGDIYPTNELTVSGSIKAKDIIISQTSWADFVLEPGYRLRSLPELESFILTQKHLPDVPSEKEVVSKGMSVASMQKLHMQKIEELTLYVIALEKENKKLKEAQDDLLKRVVRLEGQKGL